MVSEMLQQPLPPVKVPAPTVPDVDGTKDEQAVLFEDGAPLPPPALDAAVPADAAVLPLPDDDKAPDAAEEPLPDDCLDGPVPPPA